MVYTDLAPSLPLWRGRPRHSRRRTYPPSSAGSLRWNFFLLLIPVRPSSSASSSSLSSLPSASFPCHPRARFARTLKSGSRVLGLSFSRVCFFVVLTARIRRPWPDCGPPSRKEALYRDRSQTLTVWAFLAAEGGANKVKRGLKNVTLSVECGPLTVDAPLSQAPRPHDAVQEAPSSPLFLSRGLFLRHVSSDRDDTFA